MGKTGWFARVIPLGGCAIIAGVRAAGRAPALALLVALVIALSACGGKDGPPKIDLDSAVYLAYDTPRTAMSVPDETRVYVCSPPSGPGPHPFVATVKCSSPESVRVYVGYATPNWGVQWPTWAAVRTKHGVELVEDLDRGRLVIAVRGLAATQYSVEVGWK